MTISFWEHTSLHVRDELRRIADSAAGDVYVVTIFVVTEPSVDSRWSTIKLMWDTEERYAHRAKRGANTGSEELRWSIMYLADATRTLLDADSDPEGHAALERWARTEGLWFDAPRDQLVGAAIDSSLELSERIVAGLIELVRELHDDGTVQAVFGRPIPLTLVAHDDHSPYPQWSREANPPELYALFGAYYESIWSWG
jgi:hypothetical protein